MKETKSIFLEAKKQIEEGLQCLEENTLESMLRFFKIGIPTNYLHSLTKFKNEIPERTAELLNSYIKDNEFTITTENGISNSNKVVLRYENIMIAHLDLRTQKVQSFQNINRSIFDNQKQIILLEDEIIDLDKGLDNIKEKHNNTKSNVIYKISTKNKKKDIKKDMDFEKRQFEWRLEECKRLIPQYQKSVLQYKEIKKQLPTILEKLEQLGFKHSYNLQNKEYIIYYLLKENNAFATEYRDNCIVIFDKSKFDVDYLELTEKEGNIKSIFYPNNIMEDIKKHLENTNKFKHTQVVINEKEDVLRIEVVSQEDIVYHLLANGEIHINGKQGSIYDLIDEQLIRLLSKKEEKMTV